MPNLRLDSFKQAFSSGGARPNLFEVSIIDSPFGGSNSEINKSFSFLAQGASLPAATIGEILVPYMGRQLKIPGNRTYDTWDLTILNDEGFGIRDMFHTWQDAIQGTNTNISAGINTIMGQFKVSQLAKAGHVSKSYYIYNAWPSVVSDIELNWESNDALETFTVTINYSHWDHENAKQSAQGSGDVEDTRNLADYLDQASNVAAAGANLGRSLGLR